MKSKRIFAVVTAAVILIAAVTLVLRPWQHRLLLIDENSGHVFARYDVELGESFSVTFRHSVNKSDVTEIYELRSDGIYLTGCIYYAFGAGVAEVLEPGWTLETGDRGEMIIGNINMKMPHLVYIVGTIYDHRMNLHGEDTVLNELCGKNAQVRFELH